MARSLALLITCLTGLALVAGCSKSTTEGAGTAAAVTKRQPVEVTQVQRRDLTESLTVVGSLEANEAAEIRTEINGLVKAIHFEEGQQVKKGDLLMKIDDAELRAQYSQVEARYQLAELNVSRSENLSESRTISQSEYDRARSEFAAAKAELQVLKLRLEKTELKAPFDGVVGSRTISPGDYVTTNTALTTLNDLSRMKISFQVPERFLSKVRHGTPFVLRSRAIDAKDAVTGEVYFVSSVIDRNTRSSEVKGLLASPPEAFRPGMFANVEIVLEVHHGVLTVPEGAILTTASGPQLVAAKEGKDGPEAEFVPVRTGLRAKGFVEIIPADAAKFDEKRGIVAAGVGALILYPGAKLEVRPQREEFRASGEE